MFAIDRLGYRVAWDGEALEAIAALLGSLDITPRDGQSLRASRPEMAYHELVLALARAYQNAASADLEIARLHREAAELLRTYGPRVTLASLDGTPEVDELCARMDEALAELGRWESEVNRLTAEHRNRFGGDPLGGGDSPAGDHK
jgi:hypothetical protein